MRILFWNTHRNVDINSYILDIVNQNEIDVLVLAEYYVFKIWCYCLSS